MSLHYETILEFYEGWPVPYLYGVSQTGDASMQNSFGIGWDAEERLLQKEHFPKVVFGSLLSLSSMPFVIDDPRDLKDRRALLYQFGSCQ